MDKWDETITRIKNGMLAEEPDAALAGALQLLADFGRTLELISDDMDRIATAIEGHPAGAAPELTPPVHDL